MPSEIATAIAYVGAFVGLVGGGVALFNSWKAGRWLDWNGGKLVLPENLRPYMPDGAHFIQHDRLVFARALRPDLQVGEMDEDPRIQIYRISMDSFLSWLCLVASALDRKLVPCGRHPGRWLLGGQDTKRSRCPSLHCRVRVPGEH